MNSQVQSTRDSFRQRTENRRGFWNYCFDSLAASLEVLLHYNIGQSYLTFIRSLTIPTVFLVFCFIISFNFEFRTIGEALRLPGNHSSLVRYIHEPASDHEDLLGFLERLRLIPLVRHNTATIVSTHKFPFNMLANLLAVRIFPVIVAHSNQTLLWPTAMMIWGICRAHMAWNFGRDRFRRGGLHNYIGEPLPIWNPLYVLFKYLNFRYNLVRVLCEPILCILAGVMLSYTTESYPETADRILFIARWLFWGGILLGIKAYRDDSRRVGRLMATEDDFKTVEARAESERRIYEDNGSDEPHRLV